MAVFLLNDDPEAFPPPARADKSGLLAVGGDLRPQRLLAAYRSGIFPWYSEGQPLLWHSPDPRYVLWGPQLHVPRSLAKALRRGRFQVRFDTAFAQVIAHCSQVPRPGQDGTWITDAMQQAYVELHRQGYAHSAEAWLDDRLVGGVYGVSLGAAFFGESMFTLEPDASKVAFVTLVRQLEQWGIRLIDAQVETDNLARFGAQHWPRRRFLSTLAEALQVPTRQGPWTPQPGGSSGPPDTEPR